MAKKDEGTSLRPGEAVEGGILDDATVEWQECSFVMWDYQGKVAEESPALRVLMAPDDGSDPVEQYYSVGSAKDWAPARDGKSIIPIGTATALRKSANAVILLESLVNAGFPEEDIGNDVTVFEGLVCHMARVPQPKRTGLQQEEGERERTILLVDEIITLPGEKKKAKGAPKSKKDKKPKKEAPSEDLTDIATTAVMALIAEAEGEGIAKKKLPTLVFKRLKEEVDRSTLNEVAKLVYEDDFLSEGPWDYDAKEGLIS